MYKRIRTSRPSAPAFKALCANDCVVDNKCVDISSGKRQGRIASGPLSRKVDASTKLGIVVLDANRGYQALDYDCALLDSAGSPRWPFCSEGPSLDSTPLGGSGWPFRPEVR